MKKSYFKISFTALILINYFGSAQWSQINTLPVSKISAIKFFNENNGFICGGGVWKTSNGGINWVQIFSAGANSFCFIDTLKGFVCGNPARLYKTTNAGLNWDTTVLINGFSGVDAMDFFNVNTGICVGFNGIINRTSNSGLNWYRQDSAYFQEQLSVSLRPSGIGWIAGGAPYESIKKVINYGTSWSFQSPGAIGGLNGVHAFNDNIVYVCGHNGVIRRTTNSGSNWTKLDSLTSRSLKAVYFSNLNSGVVVGDVGTILRTTNSGTNWFFQTSPVNNSLYSVFFINDSTGWIGGNNGVLLKTTNGGGITFVNQLSSNIPAKFELFQNYPNPFNPQTKIKFSIAENGNVVFSIYNISGEQILKHSELLNNGYYEYDWNAGLFSSGIYFYTIQYKNISLTKKMILIK